jgi:hypothetical protein
MLGRRFKMLLLTATAMAAVTPVLLGSAGPAAASTAARPTVAARPEPAGRLVPAGRLEPASRIHADSAMPTGWVALCNDASDYYSYVEFPYRGYAASELVPPGQCWYDDLGGIGWEPVYVMGQAGNGAEFWMGTVWYDGDIEGLGVTTDGEYAAPGYYTW